MAIYTPRGLKIRLPLDYSFALMARLYPEVKPFEFLKVAEALKLLPATWASIVACVTFFVTESPYAVAIVVALTQILMHIIRLSAFPISGVLTTPAYIYSYGSGYGVFSILLSALCQRYPETAVKPAD